MIILLPDDCFVNKYVYIILKTIKFDLKNIYIMCILCWLRQQTTILFTCTYIQIFLMGKCNLITTVYYFAFDEFLKTIRNF